ncbi:MAG: oligosaccharide flippase family protein [Bacteriovoracaceae bacterium]|nr:oligosaccharide flippase family protein [Bacteriovoracaceae bacterium]
MDKKFRKDVSWNVVSFLVVGVSGILLNVLIGRYYGASLLGAFNINFAVYIFLSQLAVFGIHLSVLKYVSHHEHNDPDLELIVSSALYLVITTSLTVTTLSNFLTPLLGNIFNSELVQKTWVPLSIGLFFFALNKTLLNILNGLRLMHFFAVAQALRYIFALLITISFILLNVDGSHIGFVISLSEIFLSIILLTIVLTTVSLTSPKKCTAWIVAHLTFGKHSIIGGIMSELNTRVDVLVLGVMVNDALVGIYTVALMIFEGFVQIAMILRNNYNPIISKLINNKELTRLADVIKSGRNKFYLVMLGLALTSFIVYPFFVKFFIGPEFISSVKLYIILMTGVILSAGYLPFDMLLSQSGHPKAQSFYKSSVVLGNVLLNFIFIYYFGLVGAAIATCLVFLLSVILLKALAAKYILIRI